MILYCNTLFAQNGRKANMSCIEPDHSGETQGQVHPAGRNQHQLLRK